MEFDRRQVLAGGGACLTSCAAGVGVPRAASPLDPLLAAHADALPESAHGANHYPMAAEALEALGHRQAIAEDWRRGAAGYAGTMPPVAPLGGSLGGSLDGSERETARALGDYSRFADWREYFRAQVEREGGSAVLARWAPRLAPGIVGAAFHGVLRTAHAARALRVQDTAARRIELAVGLAYWAARYTELPATSGRDAADRIGETLATLEHPWIDDVAEVDFAAVTERLTRVPLAPLPVPDARGSAADELDRLVREAATGFLEMLVLERHRIWLLHTVTGPAAVGLLLPEVDESGARTLVACARQGVVAFFAAYGAPYVARAHLRATPPAWPELIERAVASRSVHTIKLTEALHRFDRGDDPLWRTVAVQWLEWV
jgi:hypothetical protein